MKKTTTHPGNSRRSLLLALYASTMIFALSGSENSIGWFKASIAATIIVPVLLYAYMMIYRYLKNRNK